MITEGRDASTHSSAAYHLFPKHDHAYETFRGRPNHIKPALETSDTVQMRQSDDKGGSHGPDGTVLGRERERRLRIPSGNLLLAPIDRDHVKFLECPFPIPRAGRSCRT